MPTEIVNSRLVDALKPFFVTWTAYIGGAPPAAGVNSITANDGINADVPTGDVTLNVDLATPSGLSFATSQLQIDDSVAGAGLTIASKIVAVGQGDGILVLADTVNLQEPGTVSVQTINDPTDNHTHDITTSSAITTATEIIMATDANGYHRLLRLGAGIAPLFPLHASSAANSAALQVEAPSLTTGVAVSFQAPLSTDTNSGKTFEVKAIGETFARGMFYSDGKYGTGPGGGSTRDTFLSRVAANTWLVSSNGSTGAGHLQFNNTGWAGLGPAAGRIAFEDDTTDKLRVYNANVQIDGSLGVGANPQVPLQVLGTSEQFRINYDATTFARFTHGSDNILTLSTELKIDQEQRDGFIWRMASTGDVAHGMTSIVETAVYGAIDKYSVASGFHGGLSITGFSNVDVGVRVRGIPTNGDTAKSTSSRAPVFLQANKKSGTSFGGMSSNENLVCVANGGSTQWIVDLEGDTHRNGSDNTYSDWNDAHLARAFELAMSPDSVNEQFDRWLQYGRNDLIRAGILHESGFYNESKLLRLAIGGLWQGHIYQRQLEQRIAQLEAENGINNND